jgi:hypothetical protein
MFPISISLTPDKLVLILAAAISLLFSYFPSLNTWYAKFDATKKRLIMLALLVVEVAVMALGMCNNFLVIADVVCSQAGILQLVYWMVLAVVANQATFVISPVQTVVKAAKPLAPIVKV